MLIVLLRKILFKTSNTFFSSKAMQLLKVRKPLHINFVADNYIYKNIDNGYAFLYQENSFSKTGAVFEDFSHNLFLFNKEDLLKIHSFDWLQNLKLVDNDLASKKIFTLIDTWIDNYGSTRNEVSLDIQVLASRIFNWLTSEKILFYSNQDFKNKVFKSLSFQIRYFVSVYKLYKEVNILLINKCLFTIGKSLNSTKITNLALENIIFFLKKNILADGGILDASPSYVLEVLEHIMFVFKSLSKDEVKYKNELRSFVDKIIVFIKSVSYEDGSLGVFDGGYQEDSSKINFLLSLGNMNAKPFNNLRYSGYLHLNSADKINVWLKTNNIITDNKKPKGLHKNSIFSHEILLSGERIFVNNSEQNNTNNRKLTRSHYSTVLFFDKHNRLINMPKTNSNEDCKITQRNDSNWDTTFLTYKGLLNNYGVTWFKTLSFAKKNGCLLGEELITFKSNNANFSKAVIKFILHPGIVIKDIDADRKSILLEIKNEEWIFRTTGEVFIINEIYNGIKGESFPTISVNIIINKKDKAEEWSLFQTSFFNKKIIPAINKQKT